MKKSFNITREDLRYLVNESVRKILLIRESLKEGGLYGHMYNVFDINDFSFEDLKNLVRAVFNGDLKDVSEKLDGMNIYATVTPRGEVKFARNSKQVTGDDTGMGIPEMEDRWGKEGSDPTILQAYENAYHLFSDAVSKLPDPVGFFNGNGYKLYANCEVIDPIHPNVIPYGKVVLSVHGLMGFRTDGTSEKFEIPDEEESQKMGILKKVLPTVNSKHGTAQVTPLVNFKEELKDKANEYIEVFESDIERIKEIAGIESDSAQIIDYKKTMIVRNLEFSGFEILLNQPFTDTLITRWAYSDKEKQEKPEEVQNMPNLTKIKSTIKTSGINDAKNLVDLVDMYEKTKLKTVFKELMIPIENFVFKLGNAAIKLYRGFANEGNEEMAIEKLRQQLEDTKAIVRSGNNPEEDEKLTHCLNTLNYLGNEFNATEGIVFNYGGHTFKLTGSFAALNRAINNVRMKRTPKN